MSQTHVTTPLRSDYSPCLFGEVTYQFALIYSGLWTFAPESCTSPLASMIQHLIESAAKGNTANTHKLAAYYKSYVEGKIPNSIPNAEQINVFRELQKVKAEVSLIKAKAQLESLKNHHSSTDESIAPAEKSPLKKKISIQTSQPTEYRILPLMSSDEFKNHLLNNPAIMLDPVEEFSNSIPSFAKAQTLKNTKS